MLNNCYHCHRPHAEHDMKESGAFCADGQRYLPTWPDGKPKHVEFRGGTTYLTGVWPHSIKVESKRDDEWLQVDITADESVRGYAVTFNGKSLPGTIDCEEAIRRVRAEIRLLSTDETFLRSLAERIVRAVLEA